MRMSQCFCKVVRFPRVTVKNLFHRCVNLFRASPCFSYRGRRLFLLYIIAFFVVLPLLFHDARYSVFFTQFNRTVLHGWMKAANTERLETAERYFSSLNGSGKVYQYLEPNSGDNKISVALSIITVSRNRHKIDKYEPKYLTQTVAKFHWLLDRWRQQRRDVNILVSICNVDHDVASYPEAKRMSGYFPMFTRFNETYISNVHTLEKEKQDYVFCLNNSLQVHKSAEYIFLVEDDAYPSDDMFLVLEHVVTLHTEKPYVRGEVGPKPSNIAFVKFYHPDRLLTFINFSPERLPELFAYAVLLSTVLTAGYAIVWGFPTTDGAITVDKLWKMLFGFSLVVTLACGRVVLSEWRRLASPHLYSFTPAPNCCTPAMLFPRQAAHLVATYLDAVTCRAHFGKDSALDAMLNETRMAAYLVQPNTFTHIGVYSTLRHGMVDPLFV